MCNLLTAERNEETTYAKSCSIEGTHRKFGLLAAFSMSSNVTADRTKDASDIAAAFPSSEWSDEPAIKVESNSKKMPNALAGSARGLVFPFMQLEVLVDIGFSGPVGVRETQLGQRHNVCLHISLLISETILERQTRNPLLVSQSYFKLFVHKIVNYGSVEYLVIKHKSVKRERKMERRS